MFTIFHCCPHQNKIMPSWNLFREYLSIPSKNIDNAHLGHCLQFIRILSSSPALLMTTYKRSSHSLLPTVATAKNWAAQQRFCFLAHSSGVASRPIWWDPQLTTVIGTGNTIEAQFNLRILKVLYDHTKSQSTSNVEFAFYPDSSLVANEPRDKDFSLQVSFLLQSIHYKLV